MSDDTTMTDDESTAAPVVHDDIMKRLLDYQRSLREGAEAEPAETARPMVDYSAIEAQAAAATATEEIVDLTEIEDAQSEIEVIEVVDVEEEITTPEIAKIAEPEPEPDEFDAPEAAPIEAEAARAGADLAERVDELEASVDKIAPMLAAVRSDFQDLAIRADERIAEIEDELAAVRRPGPDAE
jgi:hypothetical protein